MEGFNWFVGSNHQPWARVENKILVHLKMMGHPPSTHDITLIPGDKRRPDFWYCLSSSHGIGHIYFEVDERMHDDYTIESEQKRQTAFTLHSQNMGEAKSVFWIRLNTGFSRNPNEDQMKTLGNVLNECKDATRSGSKEGAHMIMIDYPRNHYHVNANRQRVLSKPDGIEMEEKMAENEGDFHLPLFTSFELVSTGSGFDVSLLGGTEEEEALEDDDFAGDSKMEAKRSHKAKATGESKQEEAVL